MVDFHPFVWTFDNDMKYIQYDYFNSEPIEEEIEGSYADRNAPIKTKTISWNHGIGEILNTLIQSGISIQECTEMDFSPFDCFSNLKKIEDDKFDLQSACLEFINSSIYQANKSNPDFIQIITLFAELFEKIKRLPKKSRCARSQQNQAQKLISFLKRGHVRKFYLIDNEKNYIPQELDFLRTAEFLKADPSEPKANFDKKFFEFLAQNKSFFEKELNYDQDNIVKSSNAEPAVKLINILLANFKNPANFSDDEFQYLQKIQEALKQRLIPKKICSVTLSEINENQGILFNTPKFLNLLKNNISPIYLEKHYSQNKEENNYDIEVILSCYFTSN
jgi:hypothetical protein